jgi:hypothetical protein
MIDPSRTAFPKAEAQLRHELAEAKLNVESLRRPLVRCDLNTCLGMCCHDGVYLSEDEAPVLADLVEREGDLFRALGLDLPCSPVVEGSFLGLVSGPKTATVPRVWTNRVEGYPAHFPDTACCFLLQDGRCSLQVLSETRGYHRWFYKPTGCWLHPLTTDGDLPFPLVLHDAASDPFRISGYPGFVSRTFCATAIQSRPPAFETLREELAFLGTILGRNLVAEADSVGQEPPGIRTDRQ